MRIVPLFTYEINVWFKAKHFYMPFNVFELLFYIFLRYLNYSLFIPCLKSNYYGEFSVTYDIIVEKLFIPLKEFGVSYYMY